MMSNLQPITCHFYHLADMMATRMLPNATKLVKLYSIITVTSCQWIFI